jgi:hypothetical protein
VCKGCLQIANFLVRVSRMLDREGREGSSQGSQVAIAGRVLDQLSLPIGDDGRSFD